MCLCWGAGGGAKGALLVIPQISPLPGALASAGMVLLAFAAELGCRQHPPPFVHIWSSALQMGSFMFVRSGKKDRFRPHYSGWASGACQALPPCFQQQRLLQAEVRTGHDQPVMHENVHFKTEYRRIKTSKAACFFACCAKCFCMFEEAPGIMHESVRFNHNPEVNLTRLKGIPCQQRNARPQ